mgnify:CR=1 FL=1
MGVFVAPVECRQVAAVIFDMAVQIADIARFAVRIRQFLAVAVLMIRSRGQLVTVQLPVPLGEEKCLAGIPEIGDFAAGLFVEVARQENPGVAVRAAVDAVAAPHVAESVPAVFVVAFHGHRRAGENLRIDCAAAVGSEVLQIRQPQIGAEQVVPAPGRGPFLAENGRNDQIVCVAGVHDGGGSDLLEVAAAARLPPLLPRLLQSRQKHGGQNRDDRNHHKDYLLNIHLTQI